jgi:hypothetical protein
MAEGPTNNAAHTGATVYYDGSIMKLLVDGKTMVMSDNLANGETLLGDAPAAAPVGFGRNLTDADAVSSESKT